MNIVFMGTAKFGIPALERLVASDHRVMAVVTQPDRPRGRGQEIQPCPIKQYAEEKNLYLYQPENVNEYEFLRELRALSPDVIVVVAYGQKLGDEILSLPRFYTVNIHPSLLPRYRGPAPVARAILNGDRHSGVSVIKVIQKMDAGPILGMIRAEIPPEATTPEVEEEYSKLGADLLIDVLGKIQDRSVVEVPQKERESSYARKFEKRHGKIDWRKPAQRVANFIRALQPFPVAFGFHNRKRVRFFRARVEESGQRPRERPGTVLKAEGADLHVACGNGVVALLELQGEGKNRMPADEFLRGCDIKAGDRLD